MSLTMKLKGALRALLPSPALTWLARQRSHKVFGYDRRRFLRFHAKGDEHDSWVQLCARIVFHTHALEKGLSHDDIRLGFGVAALKSLADALQTYNDKGFDKTLKPYVNALSTLREYVRLHERHDFPVNFLCEMLGDGLFQEITACQSLIGGAMQIDGSSKMRNSEKNFRQLFTERFSVRSYDDAPVDLSAIDEAIEISLKAPSVCNRQSSRVWVMTEAAQIADTLRVQGGFTGYPTPPVLLVVTSDLSGFLSLSERNQPFIDGGAFSMALLLALEYVGLAACPLNAMFDATADRVIRRVVGIGDSENIIMFIAVGNFKPVNNVAKSFRYSRQEVTHYQ